MNKTISYILTALFLLACFGSIFVNSQAFTDTQIVPKWLAACAGIVLWGVSLSLYMIASPERWKERTHKQPLLFAGIGILCLLQALYALVQAFQLMPPGHQTDFTTGSFDNPAGLAACLIAGTPLLLAAIRNRQDRYIALCIILICFPAILASESRTGMYAILSIIGIIWLRSSVKSPWKYSCATFTFLAALCLISWKPDSTSGRIYIWRCVGEMILDKPWFGHGIGAFKTHYMDWQAAYLTEHPDGAFAWLADSVDHPFNEYLSIAVQGGIVALLLVAAFAYFLYRCYRRNPTQEGKACALSLIGIAVCALFSYPLTYPFTWLILAVDSWVLISRAGFRFTPSNVQTRIVGGLLGGCCLVGVYLLHQRWDAELQWREASTLALQGNTEKAFTHYEALMPTLGNNPYFLYNYAAELLYAHRPADCLPIALQCRTYWADYDLELLLGEAHAALGKNQEAEQSFRSAAAMCPIRFVPLYRLAQLYRAEGKTEQADSLAQVIVDKPVKVPSPEINRIKAEMRVELLKNKHTQ